MLTRRHCRAIPTTWRQAYSARHCRSEHPALCDSAGGDQREHRCRSGGDPRCFTATGVGGRGGWSAQVCRRVRVLLRRPCPRLLQSHRGRLCVVLDVHPVAIAQAVDGEAAQFGLHDIEVAGFAALAGRHGRRPTALKTTVARDTPALPGASVVVCPSAGGEIQVGRQSRSFRLGAIGVPGCVVAGRVPGKDRRLELSQVSGMVEQARLRRNWLPATLVLERSVPRRSPAPPVAAVGSGQRGTWMRLILAARLACLFTGLAVGMAGCGSAPPRRRQPSPTATVSVAPSTAAPTSPPVLLLVVGGCHPHECADASGRPAAGR